jgi:zinc and cadmium transporter
MTLLFIISAGFLGGFLSLAAAALVVYGMPGHWLTRLIAFSTGIMLSSALLGMVPEAMELGLAPEPTMLTLLFGILGFFALERTTLWRHDHRHEGAACHHDHSDEPKPVILLVLLGDGFHNFVDGVVIAAAFLTDPTLGWSTALAIVAHEVPQESGDFVLLLNAGLSRSRAFLFNGLSSLTSVLGGVMGYFILGTVKTLLPYALTLAAASFIYISVADLMPLLHRHRERHAMRWQVGLLAIGVAAAPLSHLLIDLILGGHDH